jgi:hypothetical protein
VKQSWCIQNIRKVQLLNHNLVLLHHLLDI